MRPRLLVVPPATLARVRGAGERGASLGRSQLPYPLPQGLLDDSAWVLQEELESTEEADDEDDSVATDDDGSRTTMSKVMLDLDGMWPSASTAPASTSSSPTRQPSIGARRQRVSVGVGGGVGAVPLTPLLSPAGAVVLAWLVGQRQQFAAKVGVGGKLSSPPKKSTAIPSLQRRAGGQFGPEYRRPQRHV